MIETNATAETAGALAAINSGTANLVELLPLPVVPKPSTMALLGAALAGQRPTR